MPYKPKIVKSSFSLSDFKLPNDTIGYNFPLELLHVNIIQHCYCKSQKVNVKMNFESFL